jgi:hypothetical protein
MLHVDIPTLPEFTDLHGIRSDACVSIYLPTTPQTQHVNASRIAYGNHVKTALDQLDAAGFDKRRRAQLEADLEALGDDDEFWRLQARSLAVLATPDRLRTFRLATAVSDAVEVADRFLLKPLLRAIAFPQTAFVLALSEGAVRLVEVSADLPPVPVHVPGLPADASDAVGRASVNNPRQGTRLAGSSGQGVLLRQYARQVDGALRNVLAGRTTPLILAATAPLAPMFRAVCTYPALLDDDISVSPDRMSESELAQAARPVLDGYYARQIDEAKALVETRRGQRRATSDLSDAARAATNGAIELLMVDMDQVIAGTVGDSDGALSLAQEPGAGSYDVVDEIAGRAIATGARCLAVRGADLPDGVALVATLRYSA